METLRWRDPGHFHMALDTPILNRILHRLRFVPGPLSLENRVDFAPEQSDVSSATLKGGAANGNRRSESGSGYPPGGAALRRNVNGRGRK